MSLDDIRTSLQEETDLRPGLEQLVEWTRQHLPAREDEVLTMLKQLDLIEEGARIQIFTQEEITTRTNRIFKNALDALRAYAKEKDTQVFDPRTITQDQEGLHDAHKYTCNRSDQSTSFDSLNEKTPAGKPIFCYLHGDELHLHKGFARRLELELSGGLLRLENPTLQVPVQVYLREIQIEKRPNLESYKIEIARKVFGAFDLYPDLHAPLLEKDLLYLVKNSPVLNLHHLSQEDYICFYAQIHELQWDPKLTPAATRWFIREFCKQPLPPGYPRLVFLLGLEYNEMNKTVEEQVMEVVQPSDLVHVLPKLEEVPQIDIMNWLLKYQTPLKLGVRERRQLLMQYFQEEKYFMDDLIPIFEQIIHAKR